jgi:branched-chain amino acid transport system permease protein
VGCYTVAYLGKLGVPFYVTIPVAGILTAMLGVIVGLPSLKVKGIYLAIATLAAHFILSFVFREWTPVTGGIQGTTIPRANLFGYELMGDKDNFYLIYFLVIVLGIAARNLGRTYIGRAFVAVRDRDISAEILGVNLLKTKLLAFATGAFYAGVAGGVLGYFYGAIVPDYFALTLSIFYLAAVIVGGLGSVLGSIFGALFMTFVPEALRLLSNASSHWFPNAAGLVLPMGQVVFGLLIIIFLVFEPHGLTANWRRVKRYFHLWPFKT